MRAGWMRPSERSFSSVMRAISRRTPSKPDRITAFGVSSMMKSTPVRCSRARMLRPSRPMMRPFMSSAGSWTTDTVVSAAWPAARRCMTTARMLRTRRSASRLVSSSIWRTRRAESWRIWSSSSLSSSCLAWEADRPETRSSSRTWRSWACVGLAAARSLELALRARRARRSARRAPPRARSGAPPSGRSPAGGRARRRSRPWRPRLLGRRARGPGRSTVPCRRRRARGPA